MSLSLPPPSLPFPVREENRKGRDSVMFKGGFSLVSRGFTLTDSKNSGME